MTSRRGEWDAALGVQVLPVGVLPRAKSIDLLSKFRPDLPADHAALAALAELVGDLPLALHLAGSYMRRYKNDVTPEEYLAEFREARLLGHESLAAKEERSPTGHLPSLEGTFALSYRRLNANDAVDGLALALLARAAYFAAGEPIPRDWLRATVDAATPKRQFGNAVERLLELGLLEAETDGAMRLHRLLAEFALRVTAYTAAQEAVERVVLKEAGERRASGYPAQLAAVQPHLRAAVERSQGRTDELAARLCNELGVHLEMLTDYTQATPYLVRALAIREQALGPEHPDTATSLNNLAGLLRAQGDYPAARPLYERALVIREKVLESDHLNTAASLNNLAGLLLRQGDYAGARPLYEHALTICERVLGANHPSTANSLHNLASLLVRRGDYPTARPLYERALAIRERALGSDHPETTATRTALASLPTNAGEGEAGRDG